MTMTFKSNGKVERLEQITVSNVPDSNQQPVQKSLNVVVRPCHSLILTRSSTHYYHTKHGTVIPYKGTEVHPAYGWYGRRMHLYTYVLAQNAANR